MTIELPLSSLTEESIKQHMSVMRTILFKYVVDDTINTTFTDILLEFLRPYKATFTYKNKRQKTNIIFVFHHQKHYNWFILKYPIK